MNGSSWSSPGELVSCFGVPDLHWAYLPINASIEEYLLIGESPDFRFLGVCLERGSSSLRNGWELDSRRWEHIFLAISTFSFFFSSSSVYSLFSIISLKIFFPGFN